MPYATCVAVMHDPGVPMPDDDEAGAAAMTRERGFELEELRPRSDRERAAPVDSSERPRRYRETRRHKRQLEEGGLHAETGLVAD